MNRFPKSLFTLGTHLRGFSVHGMSLELNRLFATLRPHQVQDYLHSKADALKTVITPPSSIEERGKASAWLRFSAMFDKLMSQLRDTPTEPSELKDLWTPTTLEAIDQDTYRVLQQQPHYAALLTDEARLWWGIAPTSNGAPQAPLTRDEMRTLVMHTHARHAFFELHNFVQRAELLGLYGLSNRFKPQLSALRHAHQKLVLNGLGVELTTRKALRDSDETDLLLHRLKHQKTVYMPLGSWGDTGYCFDEKQGYSHILECRTLAVDVTPLGKAFMRDDHASEYKEYLVADGWLALAGVDKKVVPGYCSRTALGRDVNVYMVKHLPGGHPKP